MGILLLLILSTFLGWAFTENANRKVEKLQIELDEVKLTLAQTLEQHQFEKKVWKKTVEELLNV